MNDVFFDYNDHFFLEANLFRAKTFCQSAKKLTDYCEMTTAQNNTLPSDSMLETMYF